MRTRTTQIHFWKDKKMKVARILAISVLALGLIICQAKSSEAEPLGTAFTYQGLLYDGNSPAYGEYDLQFKLYDGSSDEANQVGSDVNAPEVDVFDGYFTVELDFGGSVFDGNAVWLEIGVRPGEMNDPNGYTALSPRQGVLPTPYALQTRGLFVSDAGNLGIGTTDPDRNLDIYHSNTGGGIEIDRIDSGIWSGVVYENDGDENWFIGVPSDTNDLFFRSDASDNYMVIEDGTGNVGIGTDSPNEKLTVEGYISLAEAATDADADAGYGKVYTKTGTGKVYFRNPGGTIYDLTGDITEVGTGAGMSGGGTSGSVTLSVDTTVIPRKNVNETITADWRHSGYLDAQRFRDYDDNTYYVDPADSDTSMVAAGKVGIGTTGPDRNLDIRHSNSGGGIEIDREDSTIWSGVVYENDGSEKWFIGMRPDSHDLHVKNHADTNSLIIEDVTGNVGIGTANPGAKLQVGDTDIGHDFYIAGSPSSQSSLFFYDGGIPGGMRYNFSTDDLSVFTSSSAQMLIDSAGKVGIGVLAPMEMLDVYGTARLRKIGSGSGTYVVADANGTLWKASSSEKYKRNIEDLEINREVVLQLRPVSFEYKSSGQEDIGLIAEEVAEQLPDLVIYDQEGRPDAVKYEKVSLYLLAVVKELKAENQSLRERVEALERGAEQRRFANGKEVQ